MIVSTTSSSPQSTPNTPEESPAFLINLFSFPVSLALMLPPQQISQVNNIALAKTDWQRVSSRGRVCSVLSCRQHPCYVSSPVCFFKVSVALHHLHILTRNGNCLGQSWSISISLVLATRWLLPQHFIKLSSRLQYSVSCPTLTQLQSPLRTSFLNSELKKER